MNPSMAEAKLLCVPYKEGYSPDKIRKKILKRLQKLEKKRTPSTYVKSLPGVPADQVLSIVTNSKYIACLLKDGRVCRMKVSSSSTLTTYQVPPDFKTGSTRPGGPETSLQVLSDAEYARRLQAQFDQERDFRPSSRLGRDLDILRGLNNSLSPYAGIPTLASISPPSSSAQLNTNFTPSSPTQDFSAVSNPAYLPASVTFLTTGSGPSVVAVRTFRPVEGASVTVNNDLMDDRDIADKNREEEGSGASSDAAAAAAAARRRKREEVWPEMGEVEWMIVKQNPESLCSDNRFVSIAALHSEFLLVGGATGQLYSWPCVGGVVNPQPHPLVNELGLSNQRISFLSSSEIRASVITESGGMATFYDQLLRGCSEAGSPPLVSSLSHSLTFHPEFSSDPITSLSVSEFLTFVITRGGKVYWWGLCPQVKSSSPVSSDNHSSSSSSSAASSITEGSLVRLKNGPPCGPNALVLHCSKTHGPRVGQTVNIIERSSIDPTTSVLVKILKQDVGPEEGKGGEGKLQQQFECLEIWKQSEVVFLDDSPAVLGKVVAVDNNQAIIDVSYAQHTDIQTTSKPQGSLKVYRLGDLSPCMGVDVTGNAVGAEATPNPSHGQRVSRHVAGVVQHAPVCILDPTPLPPSSLPPIIDDSTGETKGPTMLRGFSPLAIHPTNTGPYLLIKRIEDNQTFFVCTSGTASGLIQSSSFVATGGRDSKPQKCTLEEESCHAYECALEACPNTVTPTANERVAPKHAGRKRRRKGGAQTSANETPSPPTPPVLHKTASIVDMYNSEVLCLKDVHGILIPIPPGLKLKPDPPRYLDHLAGWFPNTDPVLNNSYHSLMSRQYMLNKNKNMIMLLVVPIKQTLLPSVMKIDTISVERIVRSISTTAPSDHSPLPSSSAPSRDESTAPPAAKKIALESTDDIEMAEPKSSELESLMNVDTDETKPCSSPPNGLSQCFSPSVLYEYTSNNCNVMHVCVARKDRDDDGSSKQFIPYKGDNGANYHSLTAYPEYRETSFEELRNNYYNKGGGYEISPDMKRDFQDLAYAQVMMLDTFLSSQTIKTDVIRLLCQKNAFGETPFMTAIAYQNFTGAHKILNFIDELTPSHPSLLSEACLIRNRVGMTPLQLFFASYSTCYDIQQMRLYVSSLPLGYTAQQLLTLFKEFYPSVYKAEITRDYDDDDVVDAPDDSSDPESDEGGEGGDQAVPAAVNAPRVPQAQRRGANLHPNPLVDNNIPFRGVVYFSNIDQLRAAHLEMQDFRVFANYSNSRAGSFGQAHSVSFLAVGLEPDEACEEQGETEGAFPTLLDVGHGVVSRVTPARRSRTGGLRVGWGASKPPPNTEAKKELRKKRASAGLREACNILCAFLSRTEFATALDKNGESVLASLIHNQRCVDIFKYLSCAPSYPRYRKPLIPTKPPEIPFNEPLELVKSDTPTSEKPEGGENSSSGLWRPFGSESTPKTVVLSFGEGGMTFTDKSESLPAFKIEPPIQPPCKNHEDCFLHGIDHLNGYDLLHNTFMTWPAQVTTVLGFNPFTEHETMPTPISIQKLDCFVKRLLVSNENSFATAFLYTLSQKMNALLLEGYDILPIYEKGGELDGMNEKNLPMYVAVRYLGSLVRALALEHSRVKGTLVELPPSRELPDRLRSQEIKGKLVHETMKKSLTSFSWLAIEAMAKAAETACLPVRMGVAKPFGANSVTCEYQSSTRGPSSSRTVGDKSKHRSLDQQFHIRTAVRSSEETRSKKSVSALPELGIRLVPRQHVSQPGQGEEHEDFGMDLSDSELPGSEMGNDSFDASNRQNQPNSRIYDTQLDLYEHETMSLLNSSSSEDEDDPFADIMDGGLGTHRGRRGRRDGDDGMDGMYPYAWALDGRRIGENTPVVRPSSPTSSFFGQTEITTPLSTIPSIRFGSGFLARTFARIIKDLVLITVRLCTSKRPPLYLMEFPRITIQKLLQSTLNTLEKTWSWVTDILDVAEGQLEQGKAFDTQRYVATLRGSIRAMSSSASPSVVQRIINRTANKSFIGSTPGEYMAYLLQCQAKGNNEGSIPVIDLYGYEHVVYILDALLYTLGTWPKPETQFILKDPLSPEEQRDLDEKEKKEREKKEREERERKERREKERIAREKKIKEGRDPDEIDLSEPLFIRTESEEERTQRYNAEFFRTASSPVAPKGPFEEAFPLAKQPHLLQPYALKEQLFASNQDQEMKDEDMPSSSSLPVSYLDLDSREIPHPVTLSWTMDDALIRWNTSVSVFAHIFLAEGPGSESCNFLDTRAGFASRMARFRHQVSQLFDSTQGGRSDWASVSNTLSIRVRRDHLLEDSLECLGHLTKFHYSQVRVKFEGEDGSGPGVNRGFFASLANALKNNDMTVPPCSKLGGLFYQPGKEPEQSGLYSPLPLSLHPSMSSTKQSILRSQRSSLFRAVGRFLGLCFWFKHTIPFMLCRHVCKYLLDRDFAWHDLAFYNADLYDGLRRMMIDAKSGKTKEEFHAIYCCYFEAPVSAHKLGVQNPENVFKDLIPGGSKIPVTPERVEEYVRLYAMHVMLSCVREELMSMRSGLLDIIPSELLIGLTAEDFQLLLSGDSANISLQRLKSVMKFNHTHGRPASICDRFEKMFWRVVSHMNNNQRQQLLYFATGSASLPAPNDQEPSSIIINIDVIGGSNVESLPVASTCSLRMSIPLYPSYNILKRKLMQAIQCQAYGLG